MKQKYSSDKSYYLINKDVMKSIKKDFNYDIIIDLLNKAQINQKERNNKREQLFILKNLPEDIYENFIKGNESVEKRMKEYVSPEQIAINIPNTNDSFQIYNKFEIIESLVASEFISDISNFSSNRFSSYGSWNYPNSISDENYIECTLKENKVIINYPKNKFNNNKYVYTIGGLDADNTFQVEYLIFYNHSHSNFSKIKNDLNNYLKTVEEDLKYGPSPLVDENYEEIGKVIGINQISNSNIKNIEIENNIKGNQMNIDNNVPYNDDKNDNGFPKDNKKNAITTITPR
jgi:hypothetical protein